VKRTQIKVLDFKVLIPSWQNEDFLTRSRPQARRHFWRAFWS